MGKYKNDDKFAAEMIVWKEKNKAYYAHWEKNETTGNYIHVGLTKAKNAWITWKSSTDDYSYDSLYKIVPREICDSYKKVKHFLETQSYGLIDDDDLEKVVLEDPD